ncbi:MAG TPA: TatD family hydrolase [Opitutaceae bacterium]|jgi:TatD DNase family protein
MTIVDTHTHLDAVQRAGGLADLIRRARAADVAWMIAVGTDTDDWDLYRDVQASHGDCIRRTVGLHPCNVKDGWEAAVSLIEAHWAGPHRPVALGECGLDRFHLPKEPEAAGRLFGQQKAAFEAQLGIARRLGCPLVIHSRQAFRECVEMIDASGVDWSRVVFHCFSEGADEIGQLNRRGGRGSFTGILTYKNADAVRLAVRSQGLSRLMVETDAPFLAPVPHRGKTNEPAYVRLTAEYAAQMLGIGLAELADATTANARAFFGF